MTQREVWITGVGVISSLGLTAEETWKGLCAGQSGAVKAEQDAAKAVSCSAVAPVTGFKARKYIDRKSLKLMTAPVRYGVAAAGLALEHAGLVAENADPERFGVFVGAGQAFADRVELEYALDHCLTGTNQIDMVRYGEEGLGMIHPLWLLRGLSNNVLGFVSLKFNAQGINNNYANSGVSATQAIIMGAAAIAAGRADLVLAGGYDSALIDENLVGYGRLGMLSNFAGDPSAAHRPFDRDRSGFVPSEGAGFLLLEAAETARKRGARPLARVMGGAVTCDAFGMAEPDPSGQHLRRAVERALRFSHLEADQIDGIFAHGAASPSFDPLEAVVYRELFANRPDLPVVADKASLGHTVAASGALSTSMAALALHHQALAPIVNLEHIDPSCEGLAYVRGEAQNRALSHVLVSSAGVGGQAAALVLSRVETSA